MEKVTFSKFLSPNEIEYTYTFNSPEGTPLTNTATFTPFRLKGESVKDGDKKYYSLGTKVIEIKGDHLDRNVLSPEDLNPYEICLIVQELKEIKEKLAKFLSPLNDNLQV